MSYNPEDFNDDDDFFENEEKVVEVEEEKPQPKKKSPKKKSKKNSSKKSTPKEPVKRSFMMNVYNILDNIIMFIAPAYYYVFKLPKEFISAVFEWFFLETFIGRIISSSFMFLFKIGGGLVFFLFVSLLAPSFLFFFIAYHTVLRWVTVISTLILGRFLYVTKFGVFNYPIVTFLILPIGVIFLYFGYASVAAIFFHFLNPWFYLELLLVFIQLLIFSWIINALHNGLTRINEIVNSSYFDYNKYFREWYDLAAGMCIYTYVYGMLVFLPGTSFMNLIHTGNVEQKVIHFDFFQNGLISDTGNIGFFFLSYFVLLGTFEMIAGIGIFTREEDMY